jgi:ADP-ribosyl-[dinitrogen reductase] hydrolase
MNTLISDRLRGIAVGAAVGDALGMPLEFGLPSPSEELITTMLPGRLPAGSFTDDTEMALALAESLLAIRKLDTDDLVKHFTDWYRRNPPDVGIHTSSVLHRICAGETWQEATNGLQAMYPDTAGNGSVMRCWPAAVIAWQNQKLIFDFSRRQSLVTHAHLECSAGCVFINDMLFHLIHGKTLYDAYNAALHEVELPQGLQQTIMLAPHRKREELRNTGWVRHTIESALWGLLNTYQFKDALIQVINLGGDADTAGAVAGALAGAAYGLEAIPSTWKMALRGEWPLNSGKIWSVKELIILADNLAGNGDPEAHNGSNN